MSDPAARSPEPTEPLAPFERLKPFKPLCDRVLIGVGVPHGFGQKGTEVPANTQFLSQVHGVQVHHFGAQSDAASLSPVPSADAAWTRQRGLVVGIVTADCVPILVSDKDGECVAAIHAGWRGLAEGVIEAGIRALPKPASELVTAVGPAARGCCYEVDAPVRKALDRGYGRHLDLVLESGRAEHFQLDLPLLATLILKDLGIPPERIGVEQRLCTICNEARFDSYRREGISAGRLRHFIGAKQGA